MIEIVVATSPLVVVAVIRVVVTFYWEVQLFQKCVLVINVGNLGASLEKNFIKQTFQIQIFLLKFDITNVDVQ